METLKDAERRWKHHHKECIVNIKESFNAKYPGLEVKEWDAMAGMGFVTLKDWTTYQCSLTKLGKVRMESWKDITNEA